MGSFSFQFDHSVLLFQTQTAAFIYLDLYTNIQKHLKKPDPVVYGAYRPNILDYGKQ